VLENWRLQGLAASTVNHRRTALQHLWTVLNGRNNPNPVRDVPKQQEPEPAVRALPYTQIEAILAALPDVGQGLSGKARDGDSKTKARLRVMAYTGIPAAQLRRLKPEHIDWDAGTMRVSARRKGAAQRAGRCRSTRGRWLP
jgi:integrase